MKRLYLVAGVLTAILGASWLIAPGIALAGWGVADPDGMAIYLGQRYGAVFLALAVIFLFSARASTGGVHTGLLAGGLTGTGLSAVLSLVAALGGTAGGTIWLATVFEVALAAGFLYALINRRSEAGASVRGQPRRSERP